MRPLLGHSWFPTIRSRLLITLAGCVLLPLVGGQLWMHLVNRRWFITSEIDKYRSMTSQAASQVASLMQYSEGNLRTLSGNHLLGELGTDAEWIEAIQHIAKAGSFWTDISLYNLNGDLLKSSAPDENVEPKERTDWFKRAARGETPVISTPQTAMAHKGLHVAVYHLLSSTSSQRKVVVRGRVPFDQVATFINDVNLGQSGYLVLLDGRGNALCHYDEGMIARRTEGICYEAFASPASSGLSRDENNQEVYWIAHRLGADLTRVGEPWTLVAVVPRDQLLAPATNASIIHLGAGLATLVLVASLGYVFSRRLTQPIVHAAEAAHRLALGDTHARITADHGPREIRQLAQAFNGMVTEVIHHRTDLQKLVEHRTRSLQEQQERSNHLSAQLRAAFEATEEAILILNHDGVVLGANRRFGLFFGARVDLLPGSHFIEWQQDFFACFADPGPIAERWAHTDSEPPRSQPATKWEILRPERRVLDVYASPLTAHTGEIIGRLWVFRDLTHEQRLQESLEQAQKMEAIGRLAGGIAHDFNNLLTGILGNLSLAEGPLATPALEEPRRHVHYARSAAERAAQLVKGLLGFSRRSHLELSQCDLNAALREFLPLVQRSLGAPFPVVLQLQEPLWSVHADIGKLEQVVMNLCVNARDALQADSSHGTITIGTRNVAVLPDVPHRSHAAPGDYVCLSVTDTGCGIPPEVIDKIFEPFFTTKEQGKGTGLGLATSYGIVQQHGGWMDCQSLPGQGTIFSVFLPRNEVPTALQASIAPTPSPAELRGDETILLVDDEIMVRMVAETLLKSHGYTVLSANDGLDAVTVFRERHQEISLILMDMTMPRMSGREAFLALRAMDRFTPVVICSGYVVDLGDWLTPQGDRPNGFIQKPYNLRDLVATVRQLIDASPTTLSPARTAPGSRPALPV
jgi:signal transduction histidine kinase/CheY-like chemotaxis protein/HAMP domain-containing protein